MGWKESTRKVLVGPQVALKTTGDECWIQPKKLSQETADQIAELQRDFYAGSENRTKVRGARELAARLEKEGKTIQEADPMDLFELSPPLDPEYRKRLYLASLTGGIGKHNFVDDAGTLICAGDRLDEKTILEICEWNDLAQEIHQVIMEWNNPLATRSGGSSGTSQNGSSGEASSSQEKSSPTEMIPQS